MTVAGFTSTGSKHPVALYGDRIDGAPTRMVGSHGCITRGDDGRDYLDFIMGLGSVALGYGHPAVTEAVIDAVRRGGIGALAPAEEEATAADIAAILPWIDQVRFLKSGAEALAAAVRLARVATGRDHVLGCGYHGWLDWCSEGRGVPRDTRALYSTLEFNDVESTIDRIRRVGDRLACVVAEPVILAAPDTGWLQALRRETERLGAVLVFDEVKTAFRVAPGGASQRWGIVPDLVVLGKAMANGFPLAAVAGTSRVMSRISETWISSTTATEFVSLAAARATMQVMVASAVPAHLGAIGGYLFKRLDDIARKWPGHGITVCGVPEMCHLEFAEAAMSQRVTVGCAARGLLWKRSAYNFVSLAHGIADVDRAVAIIEEVLEADAGGSGVRC